MSPSSFFSHFRRFTTLSAAAVPEEAGGLIEGAPP